jgi:hypothetical protein
VRSERRSVNPKGRARMIRKASAAAVLAFATAGSALFGGAALAASPSVNPDCSRLISVGASLGLLGQGGAIAECNATGGSSTSTSVTDRVVERVVVEDD